MSIAYDSPLPYDGLFAYAGGLTQFPWVQLGPFVLTGAVDDDGVEWWLEDLAGWDSADVRAPSSTRPGADGLFVGTFFDGGRTLEAKGHIVGPTKAAARAARQEFAAALHVRNELTIVVHEEIERQVKGYRAERLLLRQVDAAVEFAAIIVCPDPRKYATEESSVTVAPGGSATATNDGDIATLATATLVGPIETPVIRNETTGEELTFDLELLVDETLEVDFDLRTASVAGASVRSVILTPVQWWAIEPGDNTIGLEAAASSGDAALELRWRSAWT